MSRLDTQSDRLVRGPGPFERQRSFLVQPQRFATGQVTPISEIVGRLAGAAQGINQINARKSAAEEELEQKRFNEYYVELTRLGDLYNSDPSSQNRNDYLAHRQSGFDTFGTDSSYAVQIERNTISGSDIEGKIKQDLDRARQGGFQEIIKNKRQALLSDPAFAEELASRPYDEARTILEKSILSEFDQETIDQFDPTTISLLGDETRAGAGGSTETARKAKAKVHSENLRELSFRNLNNSTGGSKDVADIQNLVIDHAQEHDLEFADVVERLTDEKFAQLRVAMNDGDTVAASDTYLALQKLESMMDNQQRDDFSQARNAVTASQAQQDSAQFIEAVDNIIPKIPTKNEAKELVDYLGVQQFNQRWGTAYTVDRLEEIQATGQQKIYLDALVKGRDTALEDFEKTTTKISSQAETLANARDATPADARAVAVASPTEREVLLGTYAEQLQQIEPENREQEELINSLLVKIDSKPRDFAVWAEVMGAHWREYQGYESVYKVFVTDSLTDTPSIDGLRGAIAFLGNDLKATRRYMAGDLRRLYAFSAAQRYEATNPSGDGVVEAYTQALNTWDGIRFDAPGNGNKGGIPMGELFTSVDFIKGFTGVEQAALSPQMKAAIVSVINLGFAEGGGADAETIGEKTRQALADTGLHLLVREQGDSATTSIVSGGFVPESYGIATVDLEKDLLAEKSQAVRFFSQQLDETGQSKNIQDVIRSRIQDTDFIRSEWKSLVDKKTISGMIDEGSIRLKVNSEFADEDGITVIAEFRDTDNTLNPMAIPLGTIDLSVMAGFLQPSFFEDKAETTVPPYVNNRYRWGPFF